MKGVTLTALLGQLWRKWPTPPLWPSVGSEEAGLGPSQLVLWGPPLLIRLAFAEVGEVLELVLLEKSSVCTVASLVLRGGGGGGIGGFFPSGDGTRGNALDGSVLLRMWGTSSSRILLQVTPPLAAAPLTTPPASLLALPLESEEDERMEERLAVRFRALMAGDDE